MNCPHLFLHDNNGMSRCDLPVGHTGEHVSEGIFGVTTRWLFRDEGAACEIREEN